MDLGSDTSVDSASCANRLVEVGKRFALSCQAVTVKAASGGQGQETASENLPSEAVEMPDLRRFSTFGVMVLNRRAHSHVTLRPFLLARNSARAGGDMRHDSYVGFCYKRESLFTSEQLNVARDTVARCRIILCGAFS